MKIRTLLSAGMVSGILLAGPVANASFIESVTGIWESLWASRVQVHGYVDLAAPIAGASVEIFDRSGAKVAKAAKLTTERGYFEAEIDGKNGPYRFVAIGGSPGEDIPETGLTAVYETSSIESGPVFINSLSTVMEAFLRKNPDEGMAGAYREIRERLGIPEWTPLLEALEGARSERPYFSPENFVRMSRHQKGIPGLIEMLQETRKGPGAETRILLFPSERAFAGTEPAMDMIRRFRLELGRVSEGENAAPALGGLFQALIPDSDHPEIANWTDETAAAAGRRMTEAHLALREIRDRIAPLRGELLAQIGTKGADNLLQPEGQSLQKAFSDIDGFQREMERLAASDLRAIDRRELGRFRNDLISASLGARRAIRRINEALTGERPQYKSQRGVLDLATDTLTDAGIGSFAAVEAVYVEALARQLQAAVLLSDAYRSIGTGGERLFRDYVKSELLPMLDTQADRYRTAAERFAMRGFPDRIDFATIQRSDFVTQLTSGSAGVVTGRIFAFTKPYHETIEKWVAESVTIGDIRPAEGSSSTGFYGIGTARFDNPEHCFFINVQGSESAPAEIQVGHQCEYRIIRFAVPVNSARRHFTFLTDPISGRTKEAVIQIRKHEPIAAPAAIAPDLVGAETAQTPAAGTAPTDAAIGPMPAPAAIAQVSKPADEPFYFGFYGDAYGLDAIGKKRNLAEGSSPGFKRLGRTKCSLASYTAGEYQYNTSEDEDREAYKLHVLGDRRVKFTLNTRPKPSGYLKEVLTARYDGTTPTRTSRFEMLRSEFLQTPASETKILGGVHVVEAGGKAEEVNSYLRPFNPARRGLDEALGLTRGTVTLEPTSEPYTIGFTHRLETKGRSRACRYRIEAMSCLSYDQFEIQLDLAE